MIHIYGFWISPTSEIHTIFNDFGHKQFIESLLGKPIESICETESKLFDEGWIRIVNTEKSFMVNYKCIMSRKQIQAIEAIEESLLKEGYFVWNCYDCFYARKKGVSQEQFETHVAELIEQKANEYKQIERNAC